MTLNRQTKERIIENYLNKYTTYRIAVRNCNKQLNYMMPTLTQRYDKESESLFVPNDTEEVAINRIENKKALKIREEIEQYKLIISCIDEAISELNEKQKAFVELRYFKCQRIQDIKEHMCYAEDKSVYRIRKQVLDKFLISLNNLISLK
jgi:DNA-directed RNA polymerase specialized sigma subunit